MNDFDPATLPLRGRRLIEASAGTGKTWTITAIFLRLLLGHGGTRAHRVQEILIVTYTKAATEELRGRIRKRLRAALDAFCSGSAPDEDALIATLLRDSIDRDADAARLRLAEMELDLASIFTIHGFATRMLERNAFESRVCFGTTIAEDDTEVITETIRDLWRERVYPLAPLPASLLLRELDVADFCSVVARLLGKHELLLLNQPERDWQTLLQDIDAAAQQLQACWMREGDALPEALAGVLLNKKGRIALERSRQRMERAEALRADTVEGLAREFLESELCKRPKSGPLPPLALFDTAQALWVDGAELAPCLLGEALHVARERLAALKERTAALGYDDLLRLLHEGLAGPGGERLAAAMRQQYPVALIDEFQDTDPLQWQIFARVYADDDTSLFLVGDPKQAIYAFRGADVQAYLQVRRQTQDRYSLTTNHRSVRPLVQAVNALHALRVDGDPFRAGSDMPFEAVAASGRPDQAPLRRDGAVMPALMVLHLPGSAPLSGSDYLARSARAAADHLGELLRGASNGSVRLGERPLQAGDIACLVRNRHQAAQLAAELNRRGIAHVQRSRESVYASPQAHDLHQILGAVLEPGSERRLRAGLGCSLLGLDATELARMLADETAFAREQSRFFEFAEELSLHGVQTTLRRLLFAYDVPARLLAREEGERALTDCLHLIELLAAERELLDSDQALLARFGHCIANHDGEKEAQQLRLESDAERLQIVTLHACKGLEYPVVYLPFMASYRPADDALFHDAHSLQACFDLKREKASIALADEERLSEDMRLLYVGLTRARHLCVLGVADVKRGNGKQSELAKTALGYLLDARQDDPDAAIARLEGIPGALLMDASALPFARPPAAAAESDTLQARQFSTPVERDWQWSSYSALARRQGNRAEQVFRQPELLADRDRAQPGELSAFGFPRGARHGSFLHGLLEHIDFAQPARMQAQIGRALAHEGYGAEWLPVLCSMLDDVLGCALDGQALRLRDIAAPARIAEMAFEFPLAALNAARLNALLQQHDELVRSAGPLQFGTLRGMLSGFIDLVFEYQGRYYVADFKSNHLGDTLADYSPPRLVASIAEHRYDLQYLIYTVALTRLLRTRLGSAYDYDTHVGGVYYLYLRGMRADGGNAQGVFFTRPRRDLVAALDALFAGGADVA
jgi:exodeoxyribonuclease V beta subunit